MKDYAALSGHGVILLTTEPGETKDGLKTLISQIDHWLEVRSSLDGQTGGWPTYQKEGLKFIRKGLQARKVELAKALKSLEDQ